MESVVSDQTAQTAQTNLKRDFTPMSECPFSHVASHISKPFYAKACLIYAGLMSITNLLVSYTLASIDTLQSG